MKELDEIEARAKAATKGPWFWQAGRHTDDPRTSDSGGLATLNGSPMTTRDGRTVENDNVIFPIAKVGGNPYWLERFKVAVGTGRAPLSLALDCFGRQEDKDFIASARTDVPRLVAALRRSMEWTRWATGTEWTEAERQIAAILRGQDTPAFTPPRPSPPSAPRP